MAAPLVQIMPPPPPPAPAAGESARKPPWLKVKAPGGPNYLTLKHIMRDLRLHTVCEAAHCPNIGECWEHRAATFMILGDVCTRNCAYCAVAHGTPAPLDTGEPARLAAAVEQMELRHVVITSVDRDDLPTVPAGETRRPLSPGARAAETGQGDGSRHAHEVGNHLRAG